MKKNINESVFTPSGGFDYIDIYEKYILDLKSCFIGSTVVNLVDEHDNLLWSCSDDIYRHELKNFLNEYNKTIDIDIEQNIILDDILILLNSIIAEKMYSNSNKILHVQKIVSIFESIENLIKDNITLNIYDLNTNYIYYSSSDNRLRGIFKKFFNDRNIHKLFVEKRVHLYDIITEFNRLLKLI